MPSADPQRSTRQEHDTKLVLSVMEVVTKSGQRGSAHTFGVCRVPLRSHKAALLKGDTVDLELQVTPAESKASCSPAKSVSSSGCMLVSAASHASRSASYTCLGLGLGLGLLR